MQRRKKHYPHFMPYIHITKAIENHINTEFISPAQKTILQVLRNGFLCFNLAGLMRECNNKTGKIVQTLANVM